MDELEKLLRRDASALERFVRFRIPDRADAEDVLQEVLLTATERFPALRDREAFKPWLLAIARSRCADYFRDRGRAGESPLSLDDPEAAELPARPHDWIERIAVRDTLAQLGERDREVLVLRFVLGLSEAETAARLGVPPGTVKSRLHLARERFRDMYPDVPRKKGVKTMKHNQNMKLPERMPDYSIRFLEDPPFPVRWEELMGWFIVPREGERLRFAMYDFPERVRTMEVALEVTGPAEVHGLRGLAIRALEYEPVESERLDDQNPVERYLVAQLTDTHCRMLAEQHRQDGVLKCYTFLDGDAFLNNWGFGEDNCGNEIDLRHKGNIHRNGDQIEAADKPFLLDVVGRASVRLGGRDYDCVCVVDVNTYVEGAMSEQYIDKEGRTVLWRRFNRDDWALDRFGQRWTERFPDNERILVNGETYVHWYDCITDHVIK